MKKRMIILVLASIVVLVLGTKAVINCPDGIPPDPENLYTCETYWYMDINAEIEGASPTPVLMHLITYWHVTYKCVNGIVKVDTIQYSGSSGGEGGCPSGAI